MTTDDTTPAESMQGRFEGRLQFQQWVRDALALAAQQGWRELVLSDADFADWPLGERLVCETLTAWARPGRKLVLLACSYDDVHRRHPRFVTWRTQWSHLVEALACRRADPLELPSALWSPHWAMRRLDPVRSTGVGGFEPERRNGVREAQDEWLRRASPSFPASVLGL